MRQSMVVEPAFGLFGLAHALSSDSLSCSCTTDGDEHSKSKPFDLLSTTSSTLDDLISHSSQLSTRHKRKPKLPISSRMTSRVFTLTSYLRHLNESDDESDDHFAPTKSIYGSGGAKCEMLSRNRSQEEFVCASSLCRSPTPNSLDSQGSDQGSPTSGASSKLLDPSRCSHLRVPIPLMISATSHASLMSDESSASSTSSGARFDESLRSSSCSSPLEHWAKLPPNSNRLSTLSHSSWEDDSDLNEVT